MFGFNIYFYIAVLTTYENHLLMLLSIGWPDPTIFGGSVAGGYLAVDLVRAIHSRNRVNQEEI